MNSEVVLERQLMITKKILPSEKGIDDWLTDYTYDYDYI